MFVLAFTLNYEKHAPRVSQVIAAVAKVSCKHGLWLVARVNQKSQDVFLHLGFSGIPVLDSRQKFGWRKCHGASLIHIDSGIKSNLKRTAVWVHKSSHAFQTPFLNGMINHAYCTLILPSGMLHALFRHEFFLEKLLTASKPSSCQDRNNFFQKNLIK